MVCIRQFGCNHSWHTNWFLSSAKIFSLEFNMLYRTMGIIFNYSLLIISVVDFSHRCFYYWNFNCVYKGLLRWGFSFDNIYKFCCKVYFFTFRFICVGFIIVVNFYFKRYIIITTKLLKELLLKRNNNYFWFEILCILAKKLL